MRVVGRGREGVGSRAMGHGNVRLSGRVGDSLAFIRGAGSDHWEKNRLDDGRGGRCSCR